MRRDDESVRTTRKVHNCPVYGWDSRQIEAWLNELPGRLVYVFWAGSAGVVAITEEVTLDEAVTAIRKVRAMAHDDDLHARIVDALEQAAFRGEWSYDPELTALEAAIATADIIVAALHHG